ncbi:MAG: hypothetical protein HRT89_06355 [Lentisphaeria bacterium]|nr:immunity 51 family protein [Lentisphaeria bacterium]NQZ67674.1 hypothetical protein [Lentisphaeria bacterium]
MIAASPIFTKDLPELNNKAIGKTVVIGWCSELPPTDFELLGVIKLSPEDLDAESNSHPSWEFLVNSCLHGMGYDMTEESTDSRDENCSLDIKVIDIDDRFALIVECFDEQIIAEFQELGFDGNGYTWCGILESIARFISEDKAREILHTPEADNAMAIHNSKEYLEEIASKIRHAFEDSEYMKIVVQGADPEYIE